MVLSVSKYYLSKNIILAEILLLLKEGWCPISGAWEQIHDVLVGVLHTDTTSVKWATGLRRLIIPGRGTVLPVTGMPFDMSRNSLCKAALEGGYSHVLHLDSDVFPPANGILQLLRHNLPLVSGLYCRRSPPHSLPVMIRNGTWVTNFVPGSLVEVDMVGAGFLLLSRWFLENLPPQRPDIGKHWFHWRVDESGGTDPVTGKQKTECLSEDFTMNIHAKRTLGVSTYVDTSVVCEHLGMASSTFRSFIPMETRAI